MITITGYSQTIDRNNVIARQKLQYSGGNPDSNKIAVSVDANGIFKWVYFTDLQDSVNTGIYDTTTANVVVTQAIRVTGAAFASDTLVSIGTSGTVSKCFATCDTIQYILDNLGGGGYSPWDTLSSKIFNKDSTAAFTHGQVFIDGTDTITVFLQNDAQDNYTQSFIYKGAGIYRRTSVEAGISGYTWTWSNQNPPSVIGTKTINLSFGDNGLNITDGTEANGYVLTSDATGNATWQDHTGYGEMGFGDSTRTIALTQNVFSVVTNTANDLWSTAAVDLHNVTYSGDSLIIDSAGTYQVNVQLSMDGTSGSVIRLGVFLNGVLACSCTGYQELLNNRILQLTYINIDALNAGDVLQVVITNTANNDDVDAIGGKITINKIR
jgi:hypothetical protein